MLYSLRSVSSLVLCFCLSASSATASLVSWVGHVPLFALLIFGLTTGVTLTLSVLHVSIDFSALTKIHQAAVLATVSVSPRTAKGW